MREDEELKWLRLLARDLTEMYRTEDLSPERVSELAKSANRVYEHWGPYGDAGQVSAVDDLVVEQQEDEPDA